MKDKVMDALQRFSKAMFIPVLILPIAGILIAVGNLFTNVRLQAVLPFLNNPVTIGFGTLLSGSLNAILGNLGVIFCVGLSVGLANKKKSEAGFISLLAFLVFLNAMNKFMNMRGMLVEGSLSGTGQAMVLGVQVLDMGVFIGLLLGIVVAAGSIVLPLWWLLRATRLQTQDLRILLPAPWSPAFCLVVFLGLANAGNLFGGQQHRAARRWPGSVHSLFQSVCSTRCAGGNLFSRGTAGHYAPQRQQRGDFCPCPAVCVAAPGSGTKHYRAGVRHLFGLAG